MTFEQCPGVHIGSTLARTYNAVKINKSLCFSRKISPPAMSGDRTTVAAVCSASHRCHYGIQTWSEEGLNTNTVKKKEIALPLTCSCSCCRRLLFHLCVVIRPARWDESTATSSSNYFAVKHTRLPLTRQVESYPCVTRRPVARVSASLTRNYALFAFTFAYKQRRPVR